MPSVSAVFICPVCIEAHESESEAESCCDMNSDPPNNDLIIPMFIAVGVSTEKYIEKFNEVNHLKG